MIVVEVAGCPGAGKTTLLPAVLRGCRQAGLHAFTVEEAARTFASRSVLGRIASTLPVAARRRALWAVYRTLSAVEGTRAVLRDPELTRYVLATRSRRPAGSDADRRRTVYWFLRTVADHAFVRAYGRDDEVVVVDEGFVHRVVQLHASSVERPAAPQVRRYVALLPVIDLLVVVQAPLAVCQRRVQERGVWARLAHRGTAEIDTFVANAHLAIELASSLVRSGNVRVLTVDNVGGLERTEDELARAVRSDLGHRRRPAPRTRPPRLAVPRAPRLGDLVGAGRHAPAIDADTCARVLARYGLESTGRPENAAGGHRNGNVVVRTSAGSVVLRRHRETATLSSVLHEHEVLRELERCDVPAVRLLPTSDGETVVRLEDRTFALFRFEDGRNLAGCWIPPGARRRLLADAGSSLAGMHRALAAFRPTAQHHLEHGTADSWQDRSLAWHLETLAGLPELALPGFGPDEPTLRPERRERIAARLTDLHGTLRRSGLPTALIHGDFGLHNLLVTRDGTLVVHDLELARREWRLVDLVIVLGRLPVADGRAFLTGYGTDTLATELEHVEAVWEHYHLSGAIRSWDNHVRYGGDQRLTTAARRLSSAGRPPVEVLAPWC